MTKWEYKTVCIHTTSINEDKILDKYGKEGWELINVILVDTYRYKSYFKRKFVEVIECDLSDLV